jgi:hypothetical protein
MDNQELKIVLEVVGEDLKQKLDKDKIAENVPIFLKPIVNQFIEKLDNISICDIINMYNTDSVLAEINNRLAKEDDLH